MSQYTYGDAVRIRRPGKEGNNWQGRYIGDSPVAGYAEIGFDKEDKTSPPLLGRLPNQARCPRKIFPFSQLEKL